jgi:hypothetical protein
MFHLKTLFWWQIIIMYHHHSAGGFCSFHSRSGQKATLNLQKQSSETASFLSRASSSLAVQVAFTFASHWHNFCWWESWGTVQITIVKDFMTNNNENDLHHSGIGSKLLNAQSNALTIELSDGFSHSYKPLNKF